MTDGEAHIRKGKLNLVDLAGSERQAKTQVTKQAMITLQEMAICNSLYGS